MRYIALYIVYACTCTVFALVFCVEAPAKFPCVEQYRFFHCIGNMQNLLDMKRLGSQSGPG